jgi:hypothetical protein
MEARRYYTPNMSAKSSLAYVGLRLIELHRAAHNSGRRGDTNPSRGGSNRSFRRLATRDGRRSGLDPSGTRGGEAPQVECDLRARYYPKCVKFAKPSYAQWQFMTKYMRLRRLV